MKKISIYKGVVVLNKYEFWYEIAVFVFLYLDGHYIFSFEIGGDGR